MRGRYPIHELNMARFETAMRRLQRVARKLGCEPIRYWVVGEEYRKAEEEQADENSYHRYLIVEVEGEEPRLEGWRFMATLQHEPGGNIVRALPGVEVPAEYRTAPRKCDHCGLIRQRKDTYLVVNDRGEYRQVGSTCLKDFLGGRGDPHALAKYLEDLHRFFEDCEREWTGPVLGALYWSTREYLGLVLAVIRQSGWCSRSKAEITGSHSTADEASSLYWSKDRTAERRRALESLSDKDWQLIDEALAWIRSRDPETEYEHNLKVACAEDYMNPRNAGLVASLLVTYQPELTGRRRGESRPIGRVGERIEAVVEVVRTLHLDGDWGGSVLHVMRDDDGNELVWFASRTELQVGRRYRIRGTVKRHEEYRGRKRTVMTRCRAEEVEIDGVYEDAAGGAVA